jgi:hypothetical protein
MRLFTLTHFGLGTLLLVAGLTLASAEELKGTPVPLGDDPAIHSTDIHSADIHSAHMHGTGMHGTNMHGADTHNTETPAPPSPPDWQAELEKGLENAFPHGETAHPNHSGLNIKQPGDEDEFNWVLLIPLLAICLSVGGPIFLVAYFGALHYRAKTQRQRELNANIDKLLAAGRDIPVELLRGDEPKRADEMGSRDKGVRNLFLGIGWLIFLTLFFGVEIGALGYIWIALGLSQLVIWKLNNPLPTTTATNNQAGQQD